MRNLDLTTRRVRTQDEVFRVAVNVQLFGDADFTSRDDGEFPSRGHVSFPHREGQWGAHWTQGLDLGGMSARVTGRLMIDHNDSN